MHACQLASDSSFVDPNWSLVASPIHPHSQPHLRIPPHCCRFEMLGAGQGSKVGPPGIVTGPWLAHLHPCLPYLS